MVVQQQKLSSFFLLPSCLSGFNGSRPLTQFQCKKRIWEANGRFHFTESNANRILSRILLKEGLLQKNNKETLKSRLSCHVDCDKDGQEADEDSSLPILSAYKLQNIKEFAVPRRKAIITSLIFSTHILSLSGFRTAFAEPSSTGFFEYIDTFDGYSFKYPQNWIRVRGSGADIFFRDPYVLDENLSVELSSPSSSKYKSVEDLGSPEEAGKKVLKQYLIEFMSTRLGVRRESNVLSTSSRVADDGRIYYQVEVNIKSYANNNELAVMPQERVTRLEWDRRYLSVLGVENNRLYELRLQSPENVFAEEENDFREVMSSFRVNKVSA